MRKPVVTFVGTEAVIQNVTRLSASTQEAIRKATKTVGYMIMNDAKLLVPVDTGRLRASLSVNWTGSGKQYGKVSGKVEVRPGSKPSTPADGVGQPTGMKGFNVVVGTNVEYGEAVENNNSPYLWPAVAMNKEKLRALLSAAMKVQVSSFKSGGGGSFFGRPL